MRDTGVGVFDLEIVRVGASFRVSDFLPFFEVGARLWAKAMLVAGDDPDEARLTASFAALCEAAAPFGLKRRSGIHALTKVPDAATGARRWPAAQPTVGLSTAFCALGPSSPTSPPFRGSGCTTPRLRRAGSGPRHDGRLIHTARCERLLPARAHDLAALLGTPPRPAHQCRDP
jgi:hypothetical protein